MTIDDWLAELDARGIRARLVVGVRGVGRLRVEPYSMLTDVDRAFIRDHRADIKERMRGGRAFVVEPVPCGSTASSVAIARQPSTTVTTPMPRVIDPETLRIINWNTPEEIARRTREATAVMLHQVGRPHPWDH